jgi:hypothetical protein
MKNCVAFHVTWIIRDLQKDRAIDGDRLTLCPEPAAAYRTDLTTKQCKHVDNWELYSLRLFTTTAERQSPVRVLQRQQNGTTELQQ